jgi:hypothetical protein
MSELGDQLRTLAEEADSWPNLVAYAAVVTKTTALRAFAEHGDEDEGRVQAARLLMNVIHERAYEGE